MGATESVQQILKDHHAVLLRSKKHLIYRLPDGRNYVTPKTSSDRRGADNALSHIKKFLNIVPEKTEPKEKSKTPKTSKRIQMENFGKPINHALADQLRKTGFTEEALRTEIDFLIGQLSLVMDELQEWRKEAEAAQNELNHKNNLLAKAGCWICKTIKKIKNWMNIRNTTNEA